jgi:hypothetical protein
MILFKYCYYFLLFLIVHTKSLSASQCYECNEMLLNHSITIDNIPSPTSSACKIVTARSTCSVRVGWLTDGASEIYYSIDQGLPSDSISVLTDRRVTTWSAEYTTRRFIIYTCTASNTTPCNTVENFKRAIASTTFPTDEQMQKFDALIAPTTEFFAASCLQSSNMTDCPQTNLAACPQCLGMIEYSEQIHTCARCPTGRAVANYFDYTATFLLNNQTRSDTIKLGCRKFGPCNSIENLVQIKNTLTTKFDFAKFNSSTALIPQLSLIVFLIMLIPKLFD